MVKVYYQYNIKEPLIQTRAQFDLITIRTEDGRNSNKRHLQTLLLGSPFDEEVFVEQAPGLLPHSRISSAYRLHSCSMLQQVRTGTRSRLNVRHSCKIKLEIETTYLQKIVTLACKNSEVVESLKPHLRGFCRRNNHSGRMFHFFAPLINHFTKHCLSF